MTTRAARRIELLQQAAAFTQQFVAQKIAQQVSPENYWEGNVEVSRTWRVFKLFPITTTSEVLMELAGWSLAAGSKDGPWVLEDGSICRRFRYRIFNNAGRTVSFATFDERFPLTEMPTIDLQILAKLRTDEVRGRTHH